MSRNARIRSRLAGLSFDDGLTHIIAVAFSTSFLGVGWAHGVTTVVEQEPGQKALADRGWLLAVLPPVVLEHLLGPLPDLAGEDGLVLPVVYLTPVGDLTQVGAVLQEGVYRPAAEDVSRPVQ